MMQSRILLALLTGVGALALATALSAQERPKIGVAVPYFGSPFWSGGLYGVEGEAEKHGYDVVKADAGDDAALQITQIQSFIDQKVSAIIIGAADGEALGPIVNTAMSAGIPVVALSTPPSAEKLTSFVGADNIGLGRLQAICLGRAMGGKGKAAVLAGPPEIWAELRVKGFTETMAIDFPEIEIVATEAGGAGKAADLMTAILAAHPDVSGVFTAADTIAVKAIEVLSSGGLAGKVAVSTTNLNPEARSAMEHGDLNCASLQPPVAMGRSAVAEVSRVLDGRDALGRVEARTYLVTKDKIGTFDFSDIVAPADYHP